MPQNLNDLTQALLDAARAAGADAADVMAEQGTSLSIDVRNGALEKAERSESIDIGLRVIVGKKQANVAASDTRADMLQELAERAVAMARTAPEDPNIGLAGPEQLILNWDPDALELEDSTPEPLPAALQHDAAEAEAAALAVKGVAQTQVASADYRKRGIHLAASNGFSGGYTLTDHSLSCLAVAGEGAGMERDYDSDSRVFQTDLRPAREIGQRAGERAAERVGACKPPTGAFPVLFDERISASLIGHLLIAINGVSVARGASWLREKLGKQIMPARLSLIEDPHRPRATGSRPFDAEGLPTQKRLVVKDGILTGWTLDLATGRKLGMASTANAKRSISSPPSPGTWNVELTQGDATRDDLISQMGTGLLVTSMIGSTINPNTGDYSRGASGFWVENGEITHPVNECTIAGSLPDMVSRMIPANDAQTHLSRVVPSLLIEGMTLAGN